MREVRQDGGEKKSTTTIKSIEQKRDREIPFAKSKKALCTKRRAYEKTVVLFLLDQASRAVDRGGRLGALVLVVGALVVVVVVVAVTG